ncbi:hypothetical protein GCM10010260_05670 [Streptomyces filipinensis]|uniref:Uncharacterized protein n=1 Tax=Streptomyces filipinensis TaxID=66887 RepID=A0A918I5Z5_9ACTN|nr:hypothetical protein [Streptomyces filipinensis]GGU76328.1 hypothetical protein GCM10010260_05670 [Streptomyces filipinensis]
MGGETKPNARRTKGRTCLKCDSPLPDSTRRIPRLFCSLRHAATGVLMTVIVVFLLVVRLSHLWVLFD